MVITLVDGRSITLANDFDDDATANRLFVSADGFLNEVKFVEASDGELHAQYGPTEQWGKWSPSDDLIFLGHAKVAQINAVADEEVSMPGLLGLGATGAAAVGGAVVLTSGDNYDNGGTGQEDTASGPDQPTVNDADTTTNMRDDEGTTHTFLRIRHRRAGRHGRSRCGLRSAPNRDLQRPNLGSHLLRAQISRRTADLKRL